MDKLEYSSKLYCYMNNQFEFCDLDGDITRDISEAAGWETLGEAKEHLLEFDNPEDWKIITKYTAIKVGEIVYEYSKSSTADNGTESNRERDTEDL